jgi:hypothetical protein
VNLETSEYVSPIRISGYCGLTSLRQSVKILAEGWIQRPSKSAIAAVAVTCLAICREERTNERRSFDTVWGAKGQSVRGVRGVQESGGREKGEGAETTEAMDFRAEEAVWLVPWSVKMPSR